MTVELTRADGVLLVRPGSALSLDGLLHLGALARSAWDERPERALVFDFGATRFTLTPERWEQSFQAAVRWHYRPDMAMAVVVPEANVPFFDARSPRWAQHGIVQAVFKSLPDALTWAQTRRLPPRRSATR